MISVHFALLTFPGGLNDPTRLSELLGADEECEPRFHGRGAFMQSHIFQPEWIAAIPPVKFR